jgi:hypothetical protein
MVSTETVAQQKSKASTSTMFQPYCCDLRSQQEQHIRKNVIHATKRKQRRSDIQLSSKTNSLLIKTLNVFNAVRPGEKLNLF